MFSKIAEHFLSRFMREVRKVGILMMEFKWPVWLPYPISWLRAGVNMAVYWLLTQVTWPGIVRDIRSGELKPEDLILVFFWLLTVQFFAISLGHHGIAKVMGRTSAWFPRWLSWREGLNGAIVLLLQLGGTMIFVMLLALVLHRQLESDEGQTWFVRLAVVGLMAIAAYLHHYDFLVRERRAAKKAMRSQARTGNKKRGKEGESSPSSANLTPPPIDPIDLELDRLRGEMGLNQMRQRKKPPENSQ